MKKIALTLVALLSVVAIALSFAACGAKGTYKFESAKIGPLTYYAGDEIPVIGSINKNDFTLKLNDDGTCSIKVYNNDSVKTGKWTEEDGKIKFDIEGLTIGEATRDGDTITFMFGVGYFTLKK